MTAGRGDAGLFRYVTAGMNDAGLFRYVTARASRRGLLWPGPAARGGGAWWCGAGAAAEREPLARGVHGDRAAPGPCAEEVRKGRSAGTPRTRAHSHTVAKGETVE